MRLIRVAESHTQIHEHTGSKTGRAQIAVVDPDERACPAAIWRIAKDLHDGLRRMSAAAWRRHIRSTRHRKKTRRISTQEQTHLSVLFLAQNKLT